MSAIFSPLLRYFRFCMRLLLPFHFFFSSLAFFLPLLSSCTSLTIAYHMPFHHAMPVLVISSAAFARLPWLKQGSCCFFFARHFDILYNIPGFPLPAAHAPLSARFFAMP